MQVSTGIKFIMYKKGNVKKEVKNHCFKYFNREVRCACDPFYLQVSLHCSSDPMLIIDHLGPIFLLVSLIIPLLIHAYKHQ